MSQRSLALRTRRLTDECPMPRWRQTGKKIMSNRNNDFLSLRVSAISPLHFCFAIQPLRFMTPDEIGDNSRSTAHPCQGDRLRKRTNMATKTTRELPAKPARELIQGEEEEVQQGAAPSSRLCIRSSAGDAPPPPPPPAESPSSPDPPPRQSSWSEDAEASFGCRRQRYSTSTRLRVMVVGHAYPISFDAVSRQIALARTSHSPWRTAIIVALELARRFPHPSGDSPLRGPINPRTREDRPRFHRPRASDQDLKPISRSPRRADGFGRTPPTDGERMRCFPPSERWHTAARLSSPLSFLSMTFRRSERVRKAPRPGRRGYRRP